MKFEIANMPSSILHPFCTHICILYLSYFSSVSVKVLTVPWRHLLLMPQFYLCERCSVPTRTGTARHSLSDTVPDDTAAYRLADYTVGDIVGTVSGSRLGEFMAGLSDTQR